MSDSIHTGHEADVASTEQGRPSTPQEIEAARLLTETDDEARANIADLFSGNEALAKAAIERSAARAGRRTQR